MKTCFKCGEDKPLGEFYGHPKMADGHLNKCKDCTRNDARQYRNANLDKIREYDRARAQLPHRIAKRERINAKFLEDHPDRHAAHLSVRDALRAGRLQKQPCVFCGSEDALEGHHHDYSRPLDVTWLCKPCHRRFHGLERMATYRGER